MTTGSSAAVLAGRTALVTGAASGIGAALARRLVVDGAAVLAVDRDEAGLKALADEVPRVEPVPCDLSDLDAVDALPTEVDVLVNNAGLQHVAVLPEFDPARFSLILRVMLEAPVLDHRLVAVDGRRLDGALSHSRQEIPCPQSRRGSWRAPRLGESLSATWTRTGASCTPTAPWSRSAVPGFRPARYPAAGRFQETWRRTAPGF